MAKYPKRQKVKRYRRSFYSREMRVKKGIGIAVLVLVMLGAAWLAAPHVLDWATHTWYTVVRKRDLSASSPASASASSVAESPASSAASEPAASSEVQPEVVTPAVDGTAIVEGSWAEADITARGEYPAGAVGLRGLRSVYERPLLLGKSGPDSGRFAQHPEPGPAGSVSGRERRDRPHPEHETMDDYLRTVLTRAVDGFIYVERTEQSGRIRQGLVGKIDLEAYSYAEGAQPEVRPSEHTVESRIPPRMAVRRGASLETPHVMMLADDPDCTLIEPIGMKKDALRKVYEGELMLGGGHIAGWAVEDPALLAQIDTALQGLGRQEVFDARYPRS